MSRLRDVADRTGDRWSAGAALRCEAMVWEADDRDRALTLLEGARDRHEDLGQPFELGRTLLVLGGTVRRARRKAAAREVLERAGALFAELPAPLWLPRAEDELDRIGLGASSRWDLTPTERRIAELVATGRASREVADELFVAPKTVEQALAERGHDGFAGALPAELGDGQDTQVAETTLRDFTTWLTAVSGHR